MAGVASLVVDPSAGAVMAMTGATVSTVNVVVSDVRVAGRVGGGGDGGVRARRPAWPGCRSRLPVASVGTVTGAPPSMTS